MGTQETHTKYGNSETCTYKVRSITHNVQGLINIGTVREHKKHIQSTFNVETHTNFI